MALFTETSVPSRELAAPNFGLASFVALSISLHPETPSRCFSVFRYLFSLI